MRWRHINNIHRWIDLYIRQDITRSVKLEDSLGLYGETKLSLGLINSI